MKYFNILGLGGYIAPRHLQAIKETGNELLAGMDVTDSVGIIDRYFPQASFFTEFERFDRHIEKLKDSDVQADYLSICTPNYLHDAHIRFGLRNGMDVICEKPLVLNPWNAQLLMESEKRYGKNVNCILQLRLHPSVIALKKKVEEANKSEKYDIDLTYITSRGTWYYVSWKGDLEKSGGIATNIGVHFYDMLMWIFGPLQESKVHVHTHDRAAGFLEFEKARVRWFLSINNETLPDEIKSAGKTTYRSLKIDDEEFEFSDGFTDLHIESYERILKGEGFGIKDAFPSIELVHNIRNTKPVGLKGNYHPLAAAPITKHPITGK
jgi:UDP-N-acetyl-2-amino-2-deoxyglucuronate dehydrogenase